MQTYCGGTCKTLMRDLKEDVNKWDTVYPCLWIGRLNIVKVSIFLKLIFRFSAIPIKIITQQADSKIYMELHNPNSRIGTHEDEGQGGRLALPDMKHIIELC